jgi:hypothetical protein
MPIFSHHQYGEEEMGNEGVGRRGGDNKVEKLSKVI